MMTEHDLLQNFQMQHCDVFIYKTQDTLTALTVYILNCSDFGTYGKCKESSPDFASNFKQVLAK